MKLYLTQAGRWAGTQADARVDGSFEQVEVPTDKPSLLDWLNNQAMGNMPDDTIVDDGDDDDHEYASLNARAKPTPAPAQPPAQSPNWKADSVMDWVLDEASTAQIEQLFARLGTRFAEQGK